MHPFNVVVTISLALCGAGALVGFALHQPGLIGVSVFFGYWATLCAIAIALLLTIILLYRSMSGTARPLFRRSWLGLVNGAIAIGIWSASVWPTR
jgi:hypothetical protein